MPRRGEEGQQVQLSAREVAAVSSAARTILASAADGGSAITFRGEGGAELDVESANDLAHHLREMPWVPAEHRDTMVESIIDCLKRAAEIAKKQAGYKARLGVANKTLVSIDAENFRSPCSAKYHEPWE